jgi:hypothetical protein
LEGDDLEKYLIVQGYSAVNNSYDARTIKVLILDDVFQKIPARKRASRRWVTSRENCS